jgi:hypothetical protein
MIAKLLFRAKFPIEFFHCFSVWNHILKFCETISVHSVYIFIFKGLRLYLFTLVNIEQKSWHM